MKNKVWRKKCRGTTAVGLCIRDHPVTNVSNGNHKGQFLWKQRNKKIIWCTCGKLEHFTVYIIMQYFRCNEVIYHPWLNSMKFPSGYFSHVSPLFSTNNEHVLMYADQLT